MKWVLVVASLILCSTVNAQSLTVVQSATIYDLYGNSIVSKMLVNETDHRIGVFNVREFSHDASARSRDSLKVVVKEWVGRRKPTPDLVIFLGEPVFDVGIPSKYSSVLIGSEAFNTVAITAASAYNSQWDPIYMINGTSPLSILRATELKRQLGDRKVESFDVDTVLDYRKLLQKLQGEPKGTIVLNVFSLLDEWRKPVGYGEIEKLLLTANSRHIDVGLCRDGFKTTFALGPTASEAVDLAMFSYEQSTKTHISSCANLGRVKAKWFDVYRKSMGKFDVVEGG